MGNNIHAVFLVSLLAACGGADVLGEGVSEHGVSVSLDLGRPICGDCCVELVERAFDGLDGVTDLAMSPGETDFSVTLGDGGPPPAELVARLKSAGMLGARLSPRGREAPGRKEWVRAR